MIRATIAAALAFTAPAAAYVTSDICDVEVSVTYTAPAEMTGTSITFTITEQHVTGSVQLQPGTFDIQVNGLLCNGIDGSDGTMVGFQGLTSAVSITGAETSPKSITVNAFDTKAYGVNLDQSADLPPIVISVSVSPAIIRAGESATLIVQAEDPVDGVDPTSFGLTMASPGGLGALSGTSCGAGTSCSLDYTAGEGDYGNIPFQWEVLDAGGQSDTVQGFLGIDSTGEVAIDVFNYHIPEMGTPTAAGGTTVNFGANADIEIPVTDIDLTQNAKYTESLTLEFTVSEIHKFAEGSQNTVNCDASDVTITPATAGDVTTFTVNWAPWASAGGVAGDYGETWCKFIFTARDSSPAGGLTSQDVEFTMAAIGQQHSGGAFGQVPIFSLVFIEHNQPVQGTQVQMQLDYADSDSTTTLTIDDGGLSESTTYGPWASENCNAGCTKTIMLDTDATTTGSKIVTVTLTDDVSGKQDVRTVQITTSPAPSRKRLIRREGPGVNDRATFSMTISEDQQLRVSRPPGGTPHSTTALAITDASVKRDNSLMARIHNLNQGAQAVTGAPTAQVPSTDAPASPRGGVISADFQSQGSTGNSDSDGGDNGKMIIAVVAVVAVVLSLMLAGVLVTLRRARPAAVPDNADTQSIGSQGSQQAMLGRQPAFEDESAV